MPGLSIIRSSCARVASTPAPGKTLQLMVAVADWGKAFSAWPARSIVATQVVPKVPTKLLSPLSIWIALGSWGFAAKLRIA